MTIRLVGKSGSHRLARQIKNSKSNRIHQNMTIYSKLPDTKKFINMPIYNNPPLNVENNVSFRLNKSLYLYFRKTTIEFYLKNVRMDYKFNLYRIISELPTKDFFNRVMGEYTPVYGYRALFKIYNNPSSKEKYEINSDELVLDPVIQNQEKTDVETDYLSRIFFNSNFSSKDYVVFFKTLSHRNNELPSVNYVKRYLVSILVEEFGLSHFDISVHTYNNTVYYINCFRNKQVFDSLLKLQESLFCRVSADFQGILPRSLGVPYNIDNFLKKYIDSYRELINEYREKLRLKRVDWKHMEQYKFNLKVHHGMRVENLYDAIVVEHFIDGISIEKEFNQLTFYGPLVRTEEKGSFKTFLKIVYVNGYSPAHYGHIFLRERLRKNDLVEILNPDDLGESGVMHTFGLDKNIMAIEVKRISIQELICIYNTNTIHVDDLVKKCDEL